MKNSFEEMQQKFDAIYSNNTWKHGSGNGSLSKYMQGYVKVIEDFIGQHNIKTVVDMGCGDWQFSQFINWQGANYQGFDIVKSVIDNNIKQYSAENISFNLYSGNSDELPPADLLITKDVLQHWSNQAVINFLPNLSKYKYCLITNCVNPKGETFNIDIEDGGFRYLDLRLEPFNLKAKEIFSFAGGRKLPFSFMGKNGWFKRVLLVETQV